MGLKRGYLETIRSVYRKEGPIGFYRGSIPPFIGSILYRSTQFSVFEAFYTRWENDAAMCKEIPGMFGLEWRTLAAAIAGGSARSLVECPFEYAKVKGQTGQKWYLSQLYTGMRVQYPRTTLMMITFFSVIELSRKNTDLMSKPYGQFLTSGTAALVGFFLIWPLEVLKNLAQAETMSMGSGTLERAKYIYRNQGIQGFWRGFVPGGQSVFLRNGASMIVMQKAQKYLTAIGLRD